MPWNWTDKYFESWVQRHFYQLRTLISKAWPVSHITALCSFTVCIEHNLRQNCDQRSFLPLTGSVHLCSKYAQNTHVWQKILRNVINKWKCIIFVEFRGFHRMNSLYISREIPYWQQSGQLQLHHSLYICC